jgi:chromosome partitioning protein
MKIVAVSNQKGGVGKTTTTVNLAAALAEHGLRVLVVDLDSQANATSGLGLTSTPGCSIYPVLMGEKRIDDQVINTPYENLTLLPAEMDLAGCEIEIARQDSHLTRLREALHDYRTRTAPDLVLLDCPPSLGILMTNALAAANTILIPMQCEYYALEGLAKMLKMIDYIRDASGNGELELEGLLMTMYDARTNLSNQVVNDVRGHLGDKVFQTIIPRTIRIAEAPSHGKPITAYDTSSIGAQAYRALATEFLKRNGRDVS